MERFLQQAISILREGKVVAYPTDTVYGLGVDAFNEQASARIYRIKQRPLAKPFPLLIADESSLTDLTSGLSEIAKRLMNHFWPGGLTLVVRKSPSLPDWLTAGGDSIAVRVPNHPVTLALIQGLEKPLIGTSAFGCDPIMLDRRLPKPPHRIIACLTMNLSLIYRNKSK